MKSKHCNWCDNSFEPNVPYQVYCSAECRSEATKEKIAERYNKNRRSSEKHKQRKCKSCGSSLSVYNEDTLCANCHVDPTDVAKALREIRGIANGK